ncbi:hypothetical protein [Sphingopyxis chilensis]
MDSVPDWLSPSAITDIALLLHDAKPAARLHVGNRGTELRRWARRLGLFTSLDADGYAAISRSPAIARKVIDLDRRPGRHTLALGSVLGYPACCSRAAARVGDEGIDRWHQAVSARRFHGHFRAIDPGGYIEGASRISHVPCSHRCKPSLALATRPERC